MYKSAIYVLLEVVLEKGILSKTAAANLEPMTRLPSSRISKDFLKTFLNENQAIFTAIINLQFHSTKNLFLKSNSKWIN